MRTDFEQSIRSASQCCFNSTPDLFNSQADNSILRPPKIIELITYVKKAKLEYYWNNTVLLLWRHVQLVKSGMGKYSICIKSCLSIVNFPSRHAPIVCKHTCIATILTCFFLLTINFYCRIWIWKIWMTSFEIFILVFCFKWVTFWQCLMYSWLILSSICHGPIS